MLLQVEQTESCALSLERLQYESDLGIQAFETVAAGNTASVLDNHALLQEQTSVEGSRPGILNLNAFETDYDKAATLSMESAGDFMVDIYLKARKFILKILEVIRAFCKRIRDFFFGGRAKKAAEQQAAVAAIAAAGNTLSINIPRDQLDNFCWFLQDENRSVKTEYTLDELVGFLSKVLDRFEETINDFRFNVGTISTVIDTTKGALDKRAYDDIETIGRSGYRGRNFRALRHFADGQGAGVLYVHSIDPGSKDEFQVLKRHPLKSPVEELTITIRPGASGSASNFFKLDTHLKHVGDLIESALGELDSVVGKGINGRPSKIDRLFEEISKTKRNIAKRKSLEGLKLIRDIFSKQTIGMVESLNNLSFVTNKIILSFDYVAKRLAALDKTTTNTEDEGIQQPEENPTAVAEAGTLNLLKELIEGKNQTDESFKAITENLRGVSLLIGKRDWSKPLVIGGKHYLEPTFVESINRIITTSTFINNMLGMLNDYDQGATAITRSKFLNINEVIAGKQLFAVYWGADGTRYTAEPTQATLTLEREKTEKLIEELTSLLISLTTAHENRYNTITKVYNAAAQAELARKEGKYYRQEDLDLIVSGFDFFDKAFCVNLLAGRLNDTITAIHSSVMITV